MTQHTQRLTRSTSQRMLGGVCGGLGEFFGIDATLIRLAVVLAGIFYPPTILLYLIAMLIIPEEAHASVPAASAETPAEPEITITPEEPAENA